MQNLSKSLNILLADSLVFYVKLHNYHWNVTGPHFNAIHQKTETLYEYFAKFYDTVAERIIQLGDKPIVTMQAALDKTQIDEESNDTFNDREVLHGVIQDLQHFHTNIKQIKELDTCDNITAMMLDEAIAYIEKELWMVKATLN